MTILPNILFLFQTLPLEPPKDMLRTLQQELESFIWAGKRPSLRRNLSYRPSGEGGLGSPNLQDYYWATQIRTFVEWSRPESEKYCFFYRWNLSWTTALANTLLNKGIET